MVHVKQHARRGCCWTGPTPTHK